MEPLLSLRPSAACEDRRGSPGVRGREHLRGREERRRPACVRGDRSRARSPRSRADRRAQPRSAPTTRPRSRPAEGRRGAGRAGRRSATRRKRGACVKVASPFDRHEPRRSRSLARGADGCRVTRSRPQAGGAGLAPRGRSASSTRRSRSPARSSLARSDTISVSQSARASRSARLRPRPVSHARLTACSADRRLPMNRSIPAPGARYRHVEPRCPSPDRCPD